MPVDVVILDTMAMPRYIYSNYRSFPSGKRHVSRRVNFCVLVFMLEGTLHMLDEDEPQSVSGGQWYLERANRRMTGHEPSQEAIKFYYIHFTALANGQDEPGFKLVEPGNYDEPSIGIMNIPVRGNFPIAEFEPLFNRLEQIKNTAPNDHLLLQGVFLELLSALMDTVYPCADPESRLVKEVLDYLTVHAERGVKINDLFPAFHFTPDYLSRLLRQKIGISAKEYLQRLRLARAMDLLNNTDLPLDQVAEAAGFGDVTLLFRTFRARTGETPARWRKRRR